MTLRSFSKCFDGDLRPLVVSGTPPQQAVDDKWQDLYSDYATKAGGAPMLALLKRLCTVQVLASKILRIEAIIATLGLADDARLYDALKKDGFGLHAARLAAEPDADSYENILGDIEAQLKPQRMKLESMAAQMPTPTDDRKQPTLDDFADNLRHINEHYKLSLTLDVSTYDYCGYISDMRKDVQARTKAAAAGKGQKNNMHDGAER